MEPYEFFIFTCLLYQILTIYVGNPLATMFALAWKRLASNMADGSPTNNNNTSITGNNTGRGNTEPQLQRCCLNYYNTRNCPKGVECEYLHKARWEMDIIRVMPSSDCFLGRPRLMQRTCRYYLRGHCIHMNNCRFKHGEEHDENLRNNQVARVPMPSQEIYVPRYELCELPQFELLNITDRVKDLNENKDETIEDGTNDVTPVKDDVASEKLQNTTSESNEGACASPPRTIDLDEWVKAPEFVPKSQLRPRSYAEALNPTSAQAVQGDVSRKLCPYATKEGVCRNLSNCAFLHGDICDMCERFVLHPYDEEEKKRHRQECLSRHEKDMELSFAIARSKEKTCGVCFEIIMEKANGEQRFGILPNCNHCFCLTCIRKWRQARQFENKIIRACPECRVTSDFVCPSMYWVDTKEDKDKLIDDYKLALSRKDCKYFKRGEGKCPFGNKCFYLHAFPDGRRCDVGPPPRLRRPRNVENDIDMLQLMLWDFLDERDFPWQSLADDLEDLVSFLADSDESDWSDYEQYDLFLD